MSHYLKIKVAIAAFAAIIITVIILLETAFFTPVTYKRWQALSWNDFNGIPPIFTRYDAAISSVINLEYDSTEATYSAYAAQHNVGSWVKRDSTEQGYLLRHEQYHFNITEIFARRLNQYINENPEGTLRLFNLRLESLDLDRDQLQDIYDHQTDHGSIVSIQRRWEFKIDSMLLLERGWVADQFSGAQVYFPSKPDSSKYLRNQTAARVYSLWKYGMYFGLISLQGNATKSEFIKNLDGILHKQYGVKSSAIDSVNDVRFWMIYDSGGFRNKKVWIKKDVYAYYMHTQYFNESTDTTGYAEMSESFINSFRVGNTDSHWMKMLSEVPAITVTKALKKSQEIRGKRYDCFVPQESNVQGFYRGPFYSEDGTMFVAYDFIIHPDSLHSSHLLRLDDDLYVTKPMRGRQLYSLPAKNVPKADYYVSIGYMLKQDSAKVCLPLYQHILRLAPLHMEN